jgi:hypothetical protein
VTCPLDIGRGAALAAFDSPDATHAWEAYYRSGTGDVIGTVTRGHAATEGRTCPGALRATIAFAVHDGASARVEAPWRRGTRYYDFRSRSRLHAWVKFADAGVPLYAHLSSVTLYVNSSDAASRPETLESTADSQLFSDLDWHEIVLDLPASGFTADRVVTFGIRVNPRVEAADAGALPTLEMYVDDVWLE